MPTPTPNNTTPTKDRLVGLKAVADIVSLSPSTIYRLIRAGEFPEPWKIANRSLWSASDIDGWIALQRTGIRTAHGGAND